MYRIFWCLQFFCFLYIQCLAIQGGLLLLLLAHTLVIEYSIWITLGSKQNKNVRNTTLRISLNDFIHKSMAYFNVFTLHSSPKCITFVGEYFLHVLRPSFTFHLYFPSFQIRTRWPHFTGVIQLCRRTINQVRHKFRGTTADGQFQSYKLHNWWLFYAYSF